MPQRRPLIAGNWKMNGLRADGLALAKAIGDGAGRVAGKADLVVCPPFTLLGEVASILQDQPISIGAQDCHPHPNGAHTGDVSGPMLADAGASFVILGHSERRTNHGETDDLVHDKTEAAWRAGLVAIICVGETLAEREAGRTLSVIGTQLAGSVPDGANAGNTVIAYEPVWAIGTGRVASPAQAQEVHADIRTTLASRFGGGEAARFRLLYGGSMKPDNARELLALEDVDGGLIGGASLKADDFLSIAGSCP